MVSSSTRFNRRTFTAVGVGASAALLASSHSVFAQDASPVASPEERDVAGAFDMLDLTEIVILAEEYTFTAQVPGSMSEGWYIITLQNNTDAVASANLALLPEGTSGGDLSGLMSKSFRGEGGELADWWTNATFAGGNVAAPGESTSTLAYLTPGKWFMFSTNPASIQSPSSFVVLTPEELEENYGISVAPDVGTPMASPDVAATTAAPEGVVATVRVDISDTELTMDGAPVGGDQIVLQAINTGQQVHDLILLHTEEVLDEDGAASIAMSWAKGEDTGATAIGGVGALSANHTAFTAMNVEPGTYAVFSSLPDEEGGLQFDNGLVAIFTAQ